MIISHYVFIANSVMTSFLRRNLERYYPTCKLYNMFLNNGEVERNQD